VRSGSAPHHRQVGGREHLEQRHHAVIERAGRLGLGAGELAHLGGERGRARRRVAHVAQRRIEAAEVVGQRRAGLDAGARDRRHPVRRHDRDAARRGLGAQARAPRRQRRGEAANFERQVRRAVADETDRDAGHAGSVGPRRAAAKPGRWDSPCRR
jgi:hypothetical protein